ncbi:MAG: sulfatase [Planctomycetaceae bacterium]|nr:sulfatase [Planctomycetaceae bacterium]MBP63090.1 sulfatase [Planctomycetaceae bacterium]
MQFSQRPLTRRGWMQRSMAGCGSLALSALCGSSAAARENTRELPKSHFKPRAKRVIFMFMDGGPSQHDLFDYKPELKKRHGKEGKNEGAILMGPRWKFTQQGESGMWIASELLPHLAQHADKLCVVRSMHTESSAHPLAVPMLHTGAFQSTRPSMGAWVLYGLGSVNESLPGFITINPTRIFGGPSNYGSAFLPSTYQATRIGWIKESLKDVSIDNVSSPGIPAPVVAGQLRLIQSFNQALLERTRAVQDVQGAIDSLGLAVRMQTALPHSMNLSSESPETLAMYGIGEGPTDGFGRQCLLARRFAQAGVRFIQLSLTGWDHHSKIDLLADRCHEIDRPVAALLTDLERQGMLEDTLILWGGEFGRQPEQQALDGGGKDGRNHNADGYTVWLAGGGVRGGLSYGETDPLGYEAVENKVHLHDLHATILHLLGLDHTRLTYHYSGRDFRLTDLYGDVVEDIVA